MTPIRFTNTEIAARAKALYEEKIRAAMRPEDSGKYLVIDVETGDYFMDADEIAVMKRAAEKRSPDALYGMRVGFTTMGRIGIGQAAKIGVAERLTPTIRPFCLYTFSRRTVRSFSYRAS